MILGLGIDLVEISRIRRIYERYGHAFASKILHANELAELADRTVGRDAGAQAAAFLASRFAAKEAAVKALGCGFRDGIYFHDFCVQRSSLGKPELAFYGKALDVFEHLGAVRSHLSLTHERGSAAAVVILEK